MTGKLKGVNVWNACLLTELVDLSRYNCMYFTNYLILAEIYTLSKFYVIVFIVDDFYTLLICICMYFNGKCFLP